MDNSTPVSLDQNVDRGGTKKATDSDSSASSSPESTDVEELERQAANSGVKNTKVYKGHYFKRAVAKGNARVQYGDVYNFGPCRYQGTALMWQDRHAIRTEKFAEVQVQVAIVTLLLFKILEKMLEALLNSLPGAVGGRISVLEDALGRSWRIDIDTISGWPVSTDVAQVALPPNLNIEP